MNTLELITSAIKNKKSISFEYQKQEKVQGKRIGDPHAIFVLTSLKGEQGTKVHIFQTEGVSDSKFEKPLPDFRMFDLFDIVKVKVLENNPAFIVNEKYNPLWSGYDNTIVKI